MDCNKEEALRAKALAEKKLQAKDFQGARKIAQKAQQLYADVENISQMIMVCDVHCSAEKKLFGNETDWYGILQVEQKADEATIKKQFRKFALQLHPDKNKFAGAEAAFKLVGEAQRILLDREKRIAHDRKRNPSTRVSAPYRPPARTNVYPKNDVYNNLWNGNAPYQPPTQPARTGSSNGGSSFWTMCPYCSVKYQYLREFVNRNLSCQNCCKNFVAYDLKLPSVSSVFPQQGSSSKAGFSKVEIGPKQAAAAASSAAAAASSSAAASAAAAAEKVRSFSTGAGASRVNTKKRRRPAGDDSSESIDSDSSSESDEDLEMGQDGLESRQRDSENLRRSTRQKRNISYKENISDDEKDNATPSKCSKSSDPPSTHVEDSKGGALHEEAGESNKHDGVGASMKKDEEVLKPNSKEVRLDDDDSESDSPSKKEAEAEVFEYPDPDFNDFGKDKQVECFRAGQVWAAYDVLDGMPRFYARIRKVVSRSMKLQITWLEPDPDDGDEMNWVAVGLPVSCGKLRHGENDVKDCATFSHIVSWEKGRDKDTYIVYPCVGETWAIFKNWDIRWHCDPDNHKKFEYEFVEILSEYTKEDGVSVAYLGKLKGFVSVFARTRASPFYITPSELYKFGHKVPSFRLDDKEGQGIPKGSFELDPASIPLNIEPVEPEELKVNAEKKREEEGISCKDDAVENINKIAREYVAFANGAGDDSSSPSQSPSSASSSSSSSSSSPSKGENGAGPVDISSEDETVGSDAEDIPVPDADFHDFDGEKSHGNFKTGQVWAVYADEDSLPKYYGQIIKVNPGPEFELQLRWLSCSALPSNVTPWHHKDMLVSCGTFKVKKTGRPQVYTNTGSFSHVVKAEPVDGKSGMYTIFPKKGEVWAMYKKWSPQMTSSNLVGCEYDIVEVVEQTEFLIKVWALERVEGFTSVFKPQVGGGLLEFPMAELLRFSHQVAAYRLKEERNGSLRGFLDLDTAALPLYFFASK